MSYKPGHRLNGIGPLPGCGCSDCVLAIKAARIKPYPIYGNDGLPLTADWLSVDDEAA